MGLLKTFWTKYKQISEKTEAKMRAEEAADGTNSHFHFWVEQGRVSSVSKTSIRDGNRIYPQTEFFLRRANGPDLRLFLTNADVPIADGDQVAVIFAASRDKQSGWIVRYINVGLGRSFDLEPNMLLVLDDGKYGHRWGIARLRAELQKFVTG